MSCSCEHSFNPYGLYNRCIFCEKYSLHRYKERNSECCKLKKTALNIHVIVCDRDLFFCRNSECRRAFTDESIETCVEIKTIYRCKFCKVFGKLDGIFIKEFVSDIKSNYTQEDFE